MSASALAQVISSMKLSLASGIDEQGNVIHASNFGHLIERTLVARRALCKLEA